MILAEPSRPQRLSLNDTPINGRGLALFKNHAGLQDLRLSGASLTDTGLATVTFPRSLTSIDVSRTAIPGVGFTGLGQCTTLVEFLARDSGITDDGLAVLSRVDSLTVINLSGCKRLTAAGLRSLTRLPGLAHVVLDGSSIPPQALAELAASKSLKNVSVGSVEVPVPVIDVLWRNSIQVTSRPLRLGSGLPADSFHVKSEPASR